MRLFPPWTGKFIIRTPLDPSGRVGESPHNAIILLQCPSFDILWVHSTVPSRMLRRGWGGWNPPETASSFLMSVAFRAAQTTAARRLSRVLLHLAMRPREIVKHVFEADGARSSRKRLLRL